MCLQPGLTGTHTVTVSCESLRCEFEQKTDEITEFNCLYTQIYILYIYIYIYICIYAFTMGSKIPRPLMEILFMFFSNGFIFLLQIILSFKLNNLAVSFNYNSISMPSCTTATAKSKNVCTYIYMTAEAECHRFVLNPMIMLCSIFTL